MKGAHAVALLTVALVCVLLPAQARHRDDGLGGRAPARHDRAPGKSSKDRPLQQDGAPTDPRAVRVQLHEDGRHHRALDLSPVDSTGLEDL
jgi:hypothetical protein